MVENMVFAMPRDIYICVKHDADYVVRWEHFL